MRDLEVPDLPIIGSGVSWCGLVIPISGEIGANCQLLYFGPVTIPTEARAILPSDPQNRKTPVSSRKHLRRTRKVRRRCLIGPNP